MNEGEATHAPNLASLASLPEIGEDGEGLAKQRELEEKYFSGAALEKYRK